jgi:serine acetyltransferase
MVANGRGTCIGQHVVLSDDAALGNGVTVGNSVTSYARVSVGDGCTILDEFALGRLRLTAGSTNRSVDGTCCQITIGAAASSLFPCRIRTGRRM